MPRMRFIVSMGLVFGLAFAAVPAEAQRQHSVREGQSLSRIARRYHVDLWDLALANRMRPEQRLRPGDVLTIPENGVAYVRPGQTLGQIARARGTSVEEIVRLNRLRSGAGLRAGQRLILPGYAPESGDEGGGDQQDWGRPSTPGLVRIRRNDEVTSVRLIDAQSRVTREGLERLGGLMRRNEDDQSEPPHPRLVRLLAAISDHFGGREIVLVSGRREAGGDTRETSRHVSGQATDIRVEGVPRRALWDYCRSLAQTGCGYYPRSTFVHVDVRDQAAQWVDWSRPGTRAQYGNLGGMWPRACLRRGAAAEGRCAREGRNVTRADVVPLEVQLTAGARELVPVMPEMVAEGDS